MEIDIVLKRRNILMEDELILELKDTEWPYQYTDHDRNIARAIV